MEAFEALAAWPRHELFQFVNDTRPVRGTLAGIGEPFTRADAAEAARQELVDVLLTWSERVLATCR